MELLSTISNWVSQITAMVVHSILHSLAPTSVSRRLSPGPILNSTYRRWRIIPFLVPSWVAGLPGLMLASGGLLAWWRTKRKSAAVAA